VLPDTFIIVVFERWVHDRLYLTPCVYCAYSLASERESLIFKMGKGGKRLQTTNQEIELLQQDLDDALQEIDRLQKQNNSIIGKVAEFRS
jgi:peptidoglycan hydrolase CwlO-like protein